MTHPLQQLARTYRGVKTLVAIGSLGPFRDGATPLSRDNFESAIICDAVHKSSASRNNTELPMNQLLADKPDSVLETF